ncbi:MAG: hypothetical protein V4463_09485 [Pseudomonadota bacterium]
MLNQDCDTTNLLSHYDTEASLAPQAPQPECVQAGVAATLASLLGQLVQLGV